MTFELDINTLNFVSGSVSLLIALAMAYVAFCRKSRYFSEWSIACLMLGLAYIIDSLRGSIPQFITDTMPDPMYVICLVMIARGLTRFVSLEINNKRDILIVVIFSILYIALQFLTSMLMFRYLLLLILLSAICIHCAVISFKELPNVIGSHNLLLTTSFLLLAFVLLKQPLDVLFQEASGEILTSSSHTFFILLCSVFFMLIMIGLILADVKRLDNTLGSSEVEVRRLIEDIQDDYFICSHDLQGDFSYLSPSTRQLFDCEPEQMIGRNWHDIFILPAETMEIVKQTDIECGKGNRPPKIEFVFEHPSQGECYLEVYKRPVYNHFGKVIAISAIARNISSRVNIEKNLKLLATTDELTGTLNRLEFIKRATKEIKRSERYQNPLTFMMLDIDHFKNVNDTYGHDVGDVVLKEITKGCMKELRKSDSLYRFGGEEFTVILTDTDIDSAIPMAQRLLEVVRELAIEVVDDVINVTTSIGIAQITSEDASVDAIIKRADTALYKAKENGRDQFMVDPKGLDVVVKEC